MTARLDVVVLGAGVVGLSTARALARSGAKVAVLDPDTPGGQGSRAAAGVAIPSVRLLGDPAMLEFARAAEPVLAADLSSLPEGGALRRGGGIIRLAPDAKSREALEKSAASAKGWLGEWRSAAQLIELEPVLEGTPAPGGFVVDTGYMVDTAAYLNAMMADVARHAELRLGEPAVGIERSGDRVTVRTPAGALDADRVVVAAGAWSGAIPGLRPLGIRPMRGQMLTVWSPRHRLTRIVSGAMYLAPWRAGEVVVGATEEDAGFAAYTTAAGLLQLTAAVAKMTPLLREARVLRTWAGLRSSTGSGKVLLGPYPGESRVFVASGHGGQGILTGPLSGRCMAELLTTGRSEACEPFDPQRVLGSS